MGMIVGWKSIAKAAGFHVSTLKRWHYGDCPIPFHKSEPSKQGRVMILDAELKLWLKYRANPAFRQNMMELALYGLVNQ